MPVLLLGVVLFHMMSKSLGARVSQNAVRDLYSHPTAHFLFLSFLFIFFFILERWFQRGNKF